MPFRLLHTWWARWVLFIFGWVALSLLFAPEAYLYFLLRRQPISWGDTFSLTVVNSLIALLFLPGIVWLAQHYPIERRTWRRALLVHVPACFLFSASHSVIYALACYASRNLGDTLFARFHPNLITYWAIVGFAQAVDYFRRYTERERQLAQAQLLLLKSQLQPHFLFNTLHTVSAMMHHDVKAADRMVHKLSDLLRMTVDTIGAQEVPLRQEVEFLQKYVDIEQTRFSGAFDLRLEMDPSTLDVLVPSMVLQPLVENAIRHGLDLKKAGGVITVCSRRHDGEVVVLSVSDNGRGASRDTVKEGLGITNTRQRLQQLYGDRQAFRVERRDAANGFSVSLVIPFRPAGALGGPTSKERHESDTSADRGRRELGAQADFVPSRE